MSDLWFELPPGFMEFDLAEDPEARMLRMDATDAIFVTATQEQKFSLVVSGEYILHTMIAAGAEHVSSCLLRMSDGELSQGTLCVLVERPDFGLELEPAETGQLSAAVRRRRDPRMRERVLTAHEYRCAFCGYDGRIGAVPVGLEAAHVRWFAFNGPDDVDNGLCLCSLHHKLFDKGVLGVGENHRILVSQRFVGHSPAAREHVIALADRPLIGPQPGAHPVAAIHRCWHISQVFRGSPRPATAA